LQKKLIVLLGLPRSGTTLLTAIFDVHPNITAWFEAWSSRRNKKPPPLKSISDFKKQYKSIFGENISDDNLVMFKETTAHAEAINWSEESIENMVRNDYVDIKFIWLVRDINHTFLSRVHTAKKHWGHQDWEVDKDRFHKFIDFAFYSFKRLEKITSKYDTCLLSYESLVTNIEQTLREVMKFIDLDIHKNQLEYHLHLKNHKSAGDPQVTSSPQPINPKKINDRDEEWRNYREKFLASLSIKQRNKYDYMSDIVKNIRSNGIKKL